jgi:hypothetical protein
MRNVLSKMSIRIEDASLYLDSLELRNSDSLLDFVLTSWKSVLEFARILTGRRSNGFTRISFKRDNAKT